MYYSQKFENNKNNVNGLWDTVNDLTGKNKKDSSNIFHDNDQQLTNPNDIYSASQKKQNPKTMECCEQVVGCMTIIIYISWIMINMLSNDT